MVFMARRCSGGVKGAVMAVIMAAALVPGRVEAVQHTLAVGGEHVCVITTTGGLKCWGGNTYGQLGYGDLITRGSKATTMGSALGYVNLGTGRTVKHITAGTYHTCAVLDNGTLKCWGRGTNGRLGLGSTTNYGDAVSEIGNALPAVNLGTGRTAVTAVAGDDFTCVLLDNTNVVCFGANDAGQLGRGAATGDVGTSAAHMGDALVTVNLGSDFRYAVDVTSGPCALLDDGSVKCWGRNLYGAAGVPGQGDVGLSSDMGDVLPKISLGTNLVAQGVGSAMHHNCAIIQGGDVKCWGKNTQGNLGLGNIHDRGDDKLELGDKLPFTLLSIPAIRLDGGDDHNCALLSDSTVKCWGYNYRGSLGLGDYKARGDFPGEMGVNLPTVYLGLDAKAVEVGAGGKTSCAILANGGVKCWGGGDQGKLGQGSTLDRGDESNDMINMAAIDLGTGVLAAAPILSTVPPTIAPTPAPVSILVPTSFPTPLPTAGSIIVPTAPVLPSPAPGPVGSPSPPQASPIAIPTGGGSTPEPEPVAINEDKGSTSKGVDVSWGVVTAAVVAPIGAVAVGIGALFLYKRQTASKASAATISNNAA